MKRAHTHQTLSTKRESSSQPHTYTLWICCKLDFWREAGYFFGVVLGNFGWSVLWVGCGDFFTFFTIFHDFLLFFYWANLRVTLRDLLDFFILEKSMKKTFFRSLFWVLTFLLILLCMSSRFVCHIRLLDDKWISVSRGKEKATVLPNEPSSSHLWTPPTHNHSSKKKNERASSRVWKKKNGESVGEKRALGNEFECVIRTWMHSNCSCCCSVG